MMKTNTQLQQEPKENDVNRRVAVAPVERNNTVGDIALANSVVQPTMGGTEVVVNTELSNDARVSGDVLLMTNAINNQGGVRPEHASTVVSRETTSTLTGITSRLTKTRLGPTLNKCILNVIFPSLPLVALDKQWDYDDDIATNVRKYIGCQHQSEGLWKRTWNDGLKKDVKTRHQNKRNNVQDKIRCKLKGKSRR